MSDDAPVIIVLRDTIKFGPIIQRPPLIGLFVSAVPATKLWFSVYVNRLAVCQKGSGWVPKALLNVQRIADVEEYFLRFNVLLMNYFNL